jgi:chaperonin GroES
LADVPDDIAPAVGKLPIKMLHDRILVALRKEDGDRRSTGGILIPATAQVAKRLVWGEARGVGASVRQVKVGDQVLFSPEDQHEVEVHGEDLIIDWPLPLTGSRPRGHDLREWRMTAAVMSSSQRRTTASSSSE